MTEMGYKTLYDEKRIFLNMDLLNVEECVAKYKQFIIWL